MDVFEFIMGYQTRYGLYYVDFKDKNRPRQPKMSAHWYSNFMKGKTEIILDRNIQKAGYRANQWVQFRDLLIQLEDQKRYKGNNMHGRENWCVE